MQISSLNIKMLIEGSCRVKAALNDFLMRQWKMKTKPQNFFAHSQCEEKLKRAMIKSCDLIHIKNVCLRALRVEERILFCIIISLCDN